MTFKEVCAKWRRAENKAELLRLENDALRAELEGVRKHALAMQEDLETLLHEGAEGDYLVHITRL